MSTLRLALQELREKASRASGRLAKRALQDSQVVVALAADFSGGASLAIRSEPGDSNFLGELRNSEGISFTWVDDTFGPGRWFVAHAAQGENGAFFDLICEDLEPHLLLPSRTESVRQFAKRLREWQRFLAVGAGGLGLPRQLGLWGELVALRALATEIGWNQALKGWVGPGGASQDFRLNAIAVELKSTTLDADALTISSLEQLNVADGQSLFLVHYGVALVGPHEGEPLPDAIQAIRQALSTDFISRGEFENRILGSGYHQSHEVSYMNSGFSLKKCTIYSVTEDFPRLDRSSVPVQIRDARYTLLTRGISRFEVQPDQLPVELQKIHKTIGMI